ncbi:MAG: glycosyltransferase, partial [Bryobacteraceae bacterium]
MKILLVNDYSFPGGGAEVSLLHLRELLRRLGHDARLFSTGVREGALAPEADYLCFGTSGPFRTLLQTANPWAARDLRGVVNEFRPDVIHVKMFLTQLSPLIMPVLRETPSLYYVAWYRPICPTGSKLLPGGEICRQPPGWVCHRSGCLPMRDWIPLMAQMRMFRRNLDCFRMIVANSHATRRRLEAEGISPVAVLYYGFLQRVARRPLSDPPVVGFAGRLVREKGADVLVRAFASLTGEFPQAGLWIAGDGPERAPLARLVSDLGIAGKVRFFGHLRRDEVESLFDSVWVQV